MPLLNKQPFKRNPVPSHLKPQDEVFFCEATKEVFQNYDEFFQRTILCNSMVWSCAITGKSGLTYEEAIESEKKARRRLGTIPKPLKKALVWLTAQTKRGRIADLVDDVYVYAYNRFFKGEIVEAVIKEQWYDCKVLKIIPPTEEEIAKDAQEEAEELERERKEREEKGETTPKKTKEKKSFQPLDHLFKYVVEELEPDNPEENNVYTIDCEDIRREKGTYTREKNLLFLKNLVYLASDGNFKIKPDFKSKYNVEDISFSEIFAGPQPIFEETKRLKGLGSLGQAKKSPKKESTKKKTPSKGGKNSKSSKGQGTLDSWVKGEKPKKSSQKSSSKPKTTAEIEAEIKKAREQTKRFKEEMQKRAEEAKKRKIEEKAKEKERKKEEKKLLTEVMNEWRKMRDDLECDDLKEMPKPKPVHCKIPNQLFGDFLTLLEFTHSFSEILETEHSFSNGITFDILETALTENVAGGSFYEVLSFLLGAVFDLQLEEDDEAKVDKLTGNSETLDKNILGKDEDVANQIRSATEMAHWPLKTQGQKINDLHMDQWSITEILRVHLASAGAFRSEKLIMWLYQQRGGYRLSDDPGLHFRMEEPQIIEALNEKTVYELSVEERLKILTCLMLQILSFASVRDIIEERYVEYNDARLELRSHQIAENKRQRANEEAERAKRREEKLQKKDETSTEAEGEKKKEENPSFPDASLTERQRLAIQTQKEKAEKKKQRDEEIRRSTALEKEQQMIVKLAELQNKCAVNCLGRDRAYRRFWVLDTLPGIFVEHEEEHAGTCLDQPTPKPNPNAGPMDEETAIARVKEIMNARGKSPDEKSSSDKENDEHKPDNSRSYSKKQPPPTTLKQKVLATKNGALEMASTSDSVENKDSSEMQTEVITIDDEPEEVKKVIPSDDLPWGSCLADEENCPVHSTILPKTHWSYFSSVDELDELIESLNDRGIRESELKDKLIFERDRIVRKFSKFPFDSKFNQAQENDIKMEIDNDEPTISSTCNLTLRDQILELEEKIYLGTLGTLKIRDRNLWQKAIADGEYDKQCESLKWGGKAMQETPFESRVQSLNGSLDPSRSGSPEPENKRESTGSNNSDSKTHQERKNIRNLACAVLQISQMVEEKYFKPPLGEDEKGKKKRLKEEERRKKEQELEEESEGVVTEKPVVKILTPLESWENSLMNSTSYAQIFLHLTTLENSIVWSKSLLNARCRVCRRKTDPDNMLLCDGCDRGHHTYCLKPKLKSIPEGDWFCNDCKPKERVRSPMKKSRRVFSNEEEEEEKVIKYNEESEMEDEEEEEGGEEEEQPIDEEEEIADGEEEEGEDEMEVDEDYPSDDDIPLKRSKKKRSFEPAPKKSKQTDGASTNQNSNSVSKKSSGLSMFLGRRNAAAQASERIARVTKEEIHSGHSSGSETVNSSNTQSRPTRSTRAANRRSLESSVIAAVQSSSNARSKRRRAVDDQLEVMFHPTLLEDLLTAMMKHKDGAPFDRPVTKSDAPDYHKIVTKPMDLGTIRSNINRMKYTCNQEVIEDILLVFKNCALYNPEDTDEYVAGVRLEKFFRKEAKRLGLLDEDEDNNHSRKRTRTR